MTAKPRRKCARCPRVLSKERQALKYCYLCSVAVKHEQRDKAHRTGVETRYGLQPGDYDALYAYQQGKCPICLRATGKSKRLSVDHDHKRGNTRESVRGLLCTVCNQMLGHGRDEPEFFVRAYLYLMAPPAAILFGGDNAEDDS